jgi:DNA-binding response OmpR family regulator
VPALYAVEEPRSDIKTMIKMNGKTLTVLLVSDDDADAGLIRKALTEQTDNEWRLEQVGRLSDGIDRLKKEGISAVLLDLFLPDSQGIKTFEALFEAAPLVPILLLASRKNEEIISGRITSTLTGCRGFCAA